MERPDPGTETVGDRGGGFVGGRQVVRCAPVLRLAGDEGVQDAHQGAPVEVPRLRCLSRLPRLAAETGSASVADRRAWRRRAGVAGAAAFSSGGDVAGGVRVASGADGA